MSVRDPMSGDDEGELDQLRKELIMTRILAVGLGATVVLALTGFGRSVLLISLASTVGSW